VWGICGSRSPTTTTTQHFFHSYFQDMKHDTILQYSSVVSNFVVCLASMAIMNAYVQPRGIESGQAPLVITSSHFIGLGRQCNNIVQETMIA
jgi:hypothetical protein